MERVSGTENQTSGAAGAARSPELDRYGLRARGALVTAVLIWCFTALSTLWSAGAPAAVLVPEGIDFRPPRKARAVASTVTTNPAPVAATGAVSGTAAGAVRTPAAAESPSPAAGGNLLDINTATTAQFQRLPGIGPVLAGRMVETRSRLGGFRRIEDITRVPGIGPAKFARIRPHIAAGTAGP